MIFFKPNREKDCSTVLFAGVIAAAILLFVYPAPGFFISPDIPCSLLIYNSIAGIIFILFTVLMMHFSDDQTSLKEILCIDIPDKKTISTVLTSLPCLLVAVSAITWHWKFTLKELNIPFEEKQLLFQYTDTADGIILLIIMTVFIAPVTEELLFRRVIFSFIGKFTTANIAGFITAGIFAAVHNFTAGVPGLFLMGLTFQWIFSKTSNIAASVLLHMLCNLAAIIFYCIFPVS